MSDELYALAWGVLVTGALGGLVVGLWFGAWYGQWTVLRALRRRRDEAARRAGRRGAEQWAYRPHLDCCPCIKCRGM